MNSSEIRERIEKSLPDCSVSVRDTTGGGDHFEALVVSSAFRERSVVEQHRMVYRTLGEAMAGPIHALALRTFTPEEWERVQNVKA